MKKLLVFSLIGVLILLVSCKSGDTNAESPVLSNPSSPAPDASPPENTVDTDNRDVVVFTVDEHDFYAPWSTVNQSGENVYIVDSDNEPNATSWSYPGPVPSSILPVPFSGDQDFHGSGIRSCVIHEGVAYISFVYYGVVDVYVYSIEEKTGHWMSGAIDLSAFYETTLADLRRSNEEMSWNTFVLL